MADIKTIYGNSITPPDLENKVNAIANKIPVDNWTDFKTFDINVEQVYDTLLDLSLFRYISSNLVTNWGRKISITTKSLVDNVDYKWNTAATSSRKVWAYIDNDGARVVLILDLTEIDHTEDGYKLINTTNVQESLG